MNQDIGLHLVIFEDPHGRADIFLGTDCDQHVAGNELVLVTHVLRIHFVLQIHSVFVGKRPIIAVLADLFPLLKIEALNLTIFRDEDKPGVVVIERDRANGTGRDLKRADLLQRVSAEYAHALAIYGDVVLASLRESDALRVLVLV